MYTYSWYEWLIFFYIYSFFGWIFESTYVSLKQHSPVNRGFLRLPLIPLYGTGAVMMLWVSLPVKGNPFLVYICGVFAATLLEYITGWAMERIFKVKYWDYSSQKFNLNGYICLTSSIAWGFLSIFLTELMHTPVERFVLGLPLTAALCGACALTVLFAFDSASCVRAALDLAKMLESMTQLRAEFDEAQVQLALLKMEARQRIEENREENAQRLDLIKAEASQKAYELREEAEQKKSAYRLEAEKRKAAFLEEVGQKRAAFREDAEALAKAYTQARADRIQEKADTRQERIDILSRRIARIKETRRLCLKRHNRAAAGLLRRNPSAASRHFEAAIKELKNEFSAKRPK